MGKLFIIIVILLFSLSCRDTPELDHIIYPRQGETGLNVLYDHLEDTTRLVSGLGIYAVSAFIPPSQEVMILLENTTYQDSIPCNWNYWRFIGYENDGWQILNGSCQNNTNVDSIYSTGKLENEISIIFRNKGSAVLKVFENNNLTPIYEQNLFWE